MSQKQIDNFFHAISRLVIIFPIITVILVLILKFNQQTSILKNSSVKQNQQSTKINQSLKAKKQEKISKIFNLKGPLVCNFSSTSATISAQILDNNIRATIKKSSSTVSAIMKGDCLYYWDEKNYLGEKICGLSTYLSLINSGFLGNLSDNKLLDNALPQFLPGNKSQSTNSTADIRKVMNTCVDKEIKDARIFEVPKGIKFSESNKKPRL
ncbi:MAG: hypothetical protein UR15_C0018G0003 [Parcubacteria group bacterium GW2011_GWA2_31_28]|nr:MAG: hypothetical protein UR15_C0018G0003 [Parcubacteria group bacterium GW2011_GWA2_31_28]